MTDLTHLNALETRLSNERNYLALEKNATGQEIRRVWIRQIEKEIADEKAFLGIADAPECHLSDDELLAELLGD